MLCCAALVLVIGLLREGWFLLPGTTRPTEPGFAPVARRAAPGASTGASTGEVPAPEHPAPAPATGPTVAPRAAVVAAFAVGTLTYGVVVYVLLLLDLAATSGGSVGTWLLRDAVLAIAVLTCAWGATTMPAPRARVRPERVRAAALVGLGSAWWWLGLADMHLFDLFVVADGSLGWDLVFHGAGAALIVAGAVVLARPTPPRTPLGPAATSPQESTLVR